MATIEEPPISMAEPAAAPEPIVEARRLVADLFKARPWIYRTDLLLSLVVGYSAATIYLRAQPLTLVQGISFTICGFALFRAGSFAHEIAHLRSSEMTGFCVGWNLLCGIPMIMPSHYYGNHIDHHNSHHTEPSVFGFVAKPSSTGDLLPEPPVAAEFRPRE